MSSSSNQVQTDLHIVRLLHERRLSELVVALADMIEREGHRIADESLTRLEFAVHSARTLANTPIEGHC